MRVIKIGNEEIYNDKEWGWVKGKGQPEWHKRIYDNWYNMWSRCRNLDNQDYEHYKDCLIHEDWRSLDKYASFYEIQSNFQEFINHPELHWSVEKDELIEGNRTYGPDTCCLRTSSENSKNRINRKGKPNPPKPLIGISLNGGHSLLFKSISDVKQKGFYHVSACCDKVYGKRKNVTKGYKWFYVNYKHGKRLRKVVHE